MSISVNGHALPERLVALLASDRWNARHARRLEALPIVDADVLQLLGEPGMTGETEALRDALAGGDGALFRLHAGDDPPPPGALAIDHAIVIAATRGEDGVALDYAGRTTPRVVASTADGSWVEVAKDFDAFVALIELDVR
jgi:hypothetical protein